MIVTVLMPITSIAEELVFVTSIWPPYVIEENGKIEGIDADTVREICKRQGIDGKIQNVPWKRALYLVEKGEADAIFSPKSNEERAAFLFFPKEPLNIEKTVIAAKKGSKISASSLNDFEGKIIGIVRGYVYSPEFDKHPALRKKTCDNDDQMVAMLNQNRLELIVGEEGGIKFIAKKLGFQIETVYILEETPNFVAFSKTKGEKGKSMAENFSQTLIDLKEDGTYEKIRSKYF